MATVTLAQLRARVRRYADQRPDNQALLNTDVDQLINDACAEYYDELVSVRGHAYYETTQSVSIISGTSSYALASNTYQIGTVVLGWGEEENEIVRPLAANQDIVPLQNSFTNWDRFSPKGYRVTGDQSGNQAITFFPEPTSTVTATIRYVPAFVPLAADNSAMDFVNHWHKLVCLAAASEFRGLLDLPTAQLEAKLERQRERVREMATERLQDDPAEIVDVTGRNGRWYPYPRWNSGS